MKVKIGDKEYSVEAAGGTGSVNGQAMDWDIREYGSGLFHVILAGKSYDARILKTDPENKSVSIRVNGNKYVLVLKDKYDELLHDLGLDSMEGAGIKELKAPMPGLVLDVRVKEGQTINKGDGIVVLEAMKMENVLKSPAELTVKKIHIKKGMTVDKNQILVSF